MPSLLDQQLGELLSFIVDPREKEEVRSFVAARPDLGKKVLKSFAQKKELFRRGDKEGLRRLLDDERMMIESFL